MVKLKTKKPLGTFDQWQKEVEHQGKMTKDVFSEIFKHYSTIHDKDTSLKYAVETAGKVLIAAGLAENIEETYTTFDYYDKKVSVPNFLLDSWVKKAKKLGYISFQLHQNEVVAFLNAFTDIRSESTLAFSRVSFGIDSEIAEKAGFEVDPKMPVIFRSTLEFKKDHIVFFSEKHGSQEVPFHLYYKWLYSVLSEGKINKNTSSEMKKHAKAGGKKGPSLAHFGWTMEEVDKEYPGYFATEMDVLLKKEIEKLAKLDVKPPKGKPGSIVQISKERISIKHKNWPVSVPLDPEIYYLIYSATVKNGGKPPLWAWNKLYSYLVKKKGYPEEEAAEIKDLLVPFFEYQVAKDVQAAKKVMEKEKKLKGIPKK